MTAHDVRAALVVPHGFFPKLPFQRRVRSLRRHFSQREYPQTCKLSRPRESFLPSFAQISSLNLSKLQGPCGEQARSCVAEGGSGGGQRGGKRLPEAASHRLSGLVPGWEEERICFSFILLLQFISFSILPSLNILAPSPRNPLVGQATFSWCLGHNGSRFCLYSGAQRFSQVKAI